MELEPITSIIDSRPDLTEVEFQIFTDLEPPKTIKYENAPIVKALLDNKVVLVPNDTVISKMYRFAKKKGYTLHKRKTEDGLILWLELDENQLNDK